MLYAIMKSVNNFFYARSNSGRIAADRGTFTIGGGIISPVSETYLRGQYIRIVGSVFNDYVYRVESAGDGFIDLSINDEDYPAWVEPTGAVDAYSTGDRVSHAGARHVSLINANIVVPGTDTRYWELVDEIEHNVQDEVFTGAICPLRIPKDFLMLAAEIETFQNNQSDTSNSGLIKSESFAGYSYTMATDANGNIAGWQSIYANRLNNYRKMFPERVI